MRIDVHSHFLPRNCFDMVDSVGRHYGPTIISDKKGQEEIILGGSNLGPIAKKMWDPETRIKDMDATGVDIQILSPIPTVVYYYLEVEDCLWFSRQQNDGISQVVKENPGRFLGLATVPLQEPNRALTELDRAINQLDLRGVEIMTNINGRELDAPELMPFYKEVATLDVPVLVHPFGVAGSERMKKYHLSNLIGNPLDTTLAGAHLIFGGILEKFPSLKFCLVHGGGNLPYIRGRLEHGYHARPECKVKIKWPPSHYLSLLYFDTITHFTPALEYLIASVGAGKVMLGTDYPFDMADTQPVSSVQSLMNISEAAKQQVLGDNAASIFKL
ncbi:amidohydrolase family protein [Chloroflexota bacterium]